MAASSSSSSTGFSSRSVAEADPVTRNALRYTLSVREYELLHQYLLSRTPVLRTKTPVPEKRAAPPAGKEEPDDYNATSFRLATRFFLGLFSGLKLYGVVQERVLKRPAAGGPKVPFYKNPDFRLSLSAASVLFFHRSLFRFFTRLRTSLRSDDAKPFRRRNPRVWRALTSRFAPAVGSSLSGLFLGIAQATQIRITIALYCFLRSLEFSYEYLFQRGYLKSLPDWFGIWMLMPPACGQLLHAYVFDRECFPASVGNFIMKRSPEYIQQRPANYPANLKWPNNFEIADALGEISNLKWPLFVSPILFPQAKTLPASLSKIAPITDPAHPAIKRLSCAVLHPNDPSCLRTLITYYIRAFPAMARFWVVIYGLFALPRYKLLVKMPGPFLNKFAKQVLASSLYLTSAIGTAWSSICFLHYILPGHALPTSRWLLSGFAAGMWAYVDRNSGRTGFLQVTRESINSLWLVGKKRGWWKGIKNGDVLLFTFSLALASSVYERDPKFLPDAIARKLNSTLRGEGWIDPLAKKAVTPSESESSEEKKQA